jgi:hypothetical protein
MAAREGCCRTFARSHNYFDALLVGTETGVLIDKTSETMAAVQDRGQFRGGETSTINRPQTQAHDSWLTLGFQAGSVAQKGGFGRSPAPMSETATSRSCGFGGTL